MQLRVLLPSEVFIDKGDVTSIVAETRKGSFGLLEHRRDCVAALAPGILTYQQGGGAAIYLAVDEGVLVKTGSQVLVSVRHAVAGTDIGELHDAVKREFLTLDADERKVRDALAKLESTLAGHLAEFAHER